MLEWRGALVDRILKSASVDSQGQHFMCFSVSVFVCLFVSVFDLTRVDTYTEITYVHGHSHVLGGQYMYV